MSSDIIDTLGPYVPALIIRRLAANPRPIRQPTAERLSAVVLFADITNFTALADQISQPGVVASEQLAALLNSCFSRLIDIIEAHGGEVTKFAGDALIALWPVPDNVVRLGSEAHSSLLNMALRAARCSLDIQESLTANPVFEGTELSLQLGLGAGDVYSIHLGGILNRWEFLLSGSPLAQMSLAKEQALPGMVVVSPEVWSLLQGKSTGKPLEDGFVTLESVDQTVPEKPNPLPALPEGARESLKAYIPAAIYSRLEAGHEAWSSEMRRVAVLFIKLPRYGTSIKHPYMRTLPEAQAVMETLQRALYAYAGSINKFNVDDKGITLVAALGLPPLSHNDDAARAVHAGLEMQAALKELGRQSAIGITTGWVFCGPVGNRTRREYTMVGQVVNMAARLMQAAENGTTSGRHSGNILCDEATYRVISTQTAEGQLLARQLSFKRISGIRVKGKDELVTAYRPQLKSRFRIVSPRKSISPANIIGQEDEREYLENAVRSLKNDQDGDSNLIIIEGEAGSGKSVLLRELMIKSRRLNLRVFDGAGQALEPMTDYSAWQPVFRQLFGLDSLFEDPATLRATVLQQLPPIRGERGFPAFAIQLSPLLNSVLPLDFPENRITQEMSADVRRRTTRMFLLRLLQRSFSGAGSRKPRPTLLILDNGQWLDEASWELAIAASRQVKPMVMVLATRPLCEQTLDSRFERVCRRLQILPNVSWLRLTAFDAAEANDLLCQELKVGTIPAQVLDLLMRKTGGHPQYILELARSWIRHGSLVVSNGDCSFTSDLRHLETAPLPLYVRQTIVSRVERLAPAQQLVLKVASAIGLEFTSDTLSQLYPVEADLNDLTKLLEALVEAHLISKAREGAEITFRFQSELVREVAHSLLPVSRRQQLSQQMTGSLGLLPGDPPAAII